MEEKYRQENLSAVPRLPNIFAFCISKGPCRVIQYSLLSGSTCHLTGLKYLFYAARYSLLTRPRLLQKLKLIFRKEGAAENVAGQQQQMIGGMEANGKFPSKKPPNKAVRETPKG